MEKTANVFDIERFATKDGPGIRTLVFMKGCPLACHWCANPESQVSRSEVIYYADRCAGCGRCLKICPQGAISRDDKYGLLTSVEKCSLCGLCVDECYRAARKILGKQFTVSELLSEILKDEPFYLTSGGGVTFSGGEPLLQAEFISDVSKACRARGIHVAIETCGFVPWKNFQTLLPQLDLIFYDLKHTDAQKHRQATGVDNKKILENLLELAKSFDNLTVRIPVVPGFNDTLEEFEKMFEFLAKLKKLQSVELLPYHRLGSSKYKGLGRNYLLEGVSALTPNDLSSFLEAGKKRSLPVRIGTL